MYGMDVRREEIVNGWKATRSKHSGILTVLLFVYWLGFGDVRYHDKLNSHLRRAHACYLFMIILLLLLCFFNVPS